MKAALAGAVAGSLLAIAVPNITTARSSRTVQIEVFFPE